MESVDIVGSGFVFICFDFECGPIHDSFCLSGLGVGDLSFAERYSAGRRLSIYLRYSSLMGIDSLLTAAGSVPEK